MHTNQDYSRNSASQSGRPGAVLALALSLFTFILVSAPPVLAADVAGDVAAKPGGPASIGITTKEVETGIKILTVVPGSQAEHAGLKPEEILTSVNGQLLAGFTASEASARIRGPEGTRVALTVRGLDDLNRVVRVWRGSSQPALVTTAGRAPVPEPDKLQAADATLHELFKADFAKTDPQGQLNFADTLYRNALESKNDPVARYQMLRLALDLAAKQCGIDVVLGAAEALAADYQLDVPALKVKALTTAQHLPHARDKVLAFASAYAALADEGLRTEDFALAATACANAQEECRLAQDTALYASLTKVTAEVHARQTAFDATSTARTRLHQNPDDPAANGTLGKYYSMTCEDWRQALPLLAKGNEAHWAEAAKAELAPPKDADAQAGVADKWFALATGAGAKPAQELVKAHALSWYEKALPQLGGADKTRVEKRVQELKAAAAPAPVPEAHGISQATRKAIPTDAEYSKLRDLGAAKKAASRTGGDEAKNAEFNALLAAMRAKLYTGAEDWSEEDFQERILGEVKIATIINQTLWMTYDSPLMWDSWVKFVGAAKTQQSLVRRLKDVTQMARTNVGVEGAFYARHSRDDVRKALDLYFAKNSATYPTLESRKQLVEWLKGNAVSKEALEDYMKVIK